MANVSMGDWECAEALMADYVCKVETADGWVKVSRAIAFQYFMAIDCDTHAPFYGDDLHMVKKFDNYEIWQSLIF